MKLTTAFGAIFRRDLALMRRYIFNSISSFVTLYIVFLLIFTGLRAFEGIAPGSTGSQTLEYYIVGFFMWSFAISAYSDLSWGLTNEAQAGTLEQLYLAPCGFRWISLFITFSSLTLSLIPVVISLVAMMATTGKWLSLDLVSLVPLMFITVLGAVGIGYALAGLALVFKRVQAAFQIMQFVFVGFQTVPTRLWWAKLLPLNAGNALIGEVMVNGRRLWELPAGVVLVALAVGAAYLAAGMFVFSRCERVAKDRGLLGHY